MNKKILGHYLKFGQYTDPGLYKEILKQNLPDDIQEIGLLIRKQIIHRTTLTNGNTGSNKDLRYGDMTKVPWFRQAEDDIFPTSSGMLSELFRRDVRGFVLDRAAEDKLVLTCRFTAILAASILKAKGIPTKVRSGFAPYFIVEGLEKGVSWDHWVNEYWNEKEKRWVIIDVDGSPDGIFDYSADAWIKVREGRLDGNHFRDAAGFKGLVTISWELFHDFHSLMNNEIIYQHGPSYGFGRMNKLTEDELKEIDNLARLLQKPDDNFDKIKHIWETKKKFRILKGGLL